MTDTAPETQAPGPEDPAPECPADSRPLWLRGLLGRGLSRDDRIKLLFIQLWFFVVVAQLLWLLGALLPCPIDPKSSVYSFWAVFLLRTLSPYWCYTAIFCALCAAIGRRWSLLAASCPLALPALVLFALSYVPKNVEPSESKPLKLASVNLLMINNNRQPIIEELRALKADIMVFQEYSKPWHRDLTEAFEEDYIFRVQTVRNDSFGAAIYSKKPFLNRQAKIDIGGMKVPTYRLVFEHEGQRFVLYNIHTLPPRKTDYVAEQRLQFLDLKAFFAKETKPVLVCGDFNWTEHTIYHRAMKELGFVEGHEQVGVGRGSTWPVLGVTRYLPGIRLDHMYVRGPVRFLRHDRGQGIGSDHRPIFADLVFEQGH